MSIKSPRFGWLLSAFHKKKMVAFVVAFATAEPYTVFGHMLGVLPEYRDSKVGFTLLKRSFESYKESGMKKVCWTYEPLESR
jgi:predicted GNAT superfamily acetyltransferase